MKAMLVFGSLLLVASPVLAQASLPFPWKHQDIGALQTPGTAEYVADAFVVQGTMDIWGVADGCHIAWQPAHGDTELAARVTAIENPGGVAHAKASLCIRESLDAGSRHVTLCVTPTDGTQFLCRDKTNGKTIRVLAPGEATKAGVPKGQFPSWLKIVRRGNEFTGYESVDGDQWHLSGRIELDLAADAVIGLAASSHKADILTKATFDHVTLRNRPTSAQKVKVAADFVVSTHGNDSWSGTLAEPKADKSDGPLATVERAAELVAELRKKDPGRERPVVVAIRGGVYFLERPITLGPEVSGSEKSPTVFEALGDERPILSGGRKITAWKVGGDGRWQAELADVKAGKWNFEQLFVDDARRYRPRLPKQGYYKIAKQLEPTPAAAGKGCDQFEFDDEEIRPDWANMGDVEVIPFHEWAVSRMHVAAVDADEHRVVFTGHTWGLDHWAAFQKGYRYLVENVREALDEPGQWYLDRPSGRLTYIPLPGEDASKAVVIAPRLDRLLVLTGDLASRRWTEHIEFRGLTFAHTNWVLPPKGQAFPQAEIGLDSAVVALAARNVAFDRCVVRHTGGYAMAFGAGCRHNRVDSCELVDLGGGGIKIGHANAGTWDDVGRMFSDESEELVSHHTVRNCLIAHCGRLHPAAVGVWIGQSPYNVIEHNDIFDLYYTGISVGWTWGYGPSRAHHNDIGFNHVHTLGQKILSDMGGIYTLGMQPGTIVHDNCFHDIQSFSYGGWGLYTDEGSTDIVLERNLVYRTKCGGFHQHYGKENVIRNNIFALAYQQQLQRTRTEEHKSFTFERNIVYWDNGSPLLGANWKDNNFKMDNNLYWQATEKPVLFPGGLTLQEWREKRGQEEHSIVADPLFVDPQKGDFHLKPDSPALKIGFQPFDYSQAGQTTPTGLTNSLPPVPAGLW